MGSSMARTGKGPAAPSSGAAAFTTQRLLRTIARQRRFVLMERFLLVFDLDGTLVDSVPDLRAALNEMLRERGRRPLSPLQVKRMVGDGAPALVARALAAGGGGSHGMAAALPRFLEIYEANAAHL